MLADSRRGLHAFPAARLQDECRGARPDDAIDGHRSRGREEPCRGPRPQAPASRCSSRWPSAGSWARCPANAPSMCTAYPVRGPIDVVGAGDAVTANLAAALAAGADAREAMELAMAAASLVIHQLGTTGTASVAQIARLLSHPGDQ